jgi:hypothetical protein
VITCNKDRFSVGDDVSEDLCVASDADEYSLLGGKAEGLILELATISVDGTEGSNWWNSTDVGTTNKKHMLLRLAAWETTNCQNRFGMLPGSIIALADARRNPMLFLTTPIAGMLVL